MALIDELNQLVEEIDSVSNKPPVGGLSHFLGLYLNKVEAVDDFIKVISNTVKGLPFLCNLYILRTVNPPQVGIQIEHGNPDLYSQLKGAVLKDLESNGFIFGKDFTIVLQS